MPTTTDPAGYLGRIDRHLAKMERDGHRVEVLGDGGFGAGSVRALLLKITGLHSDSPASGVRMYVGNIYNNGTEASPTQTGVTVRIPDLGADITLPSFGAWSDVRACSGIPVRETWTGATATHTLDTVYYAIGPLVIA